MKRKFKQWWSTNPPISTKQTITSHRTQKTNTTYDVGNPGPCLGQAHKSGGVKIGSKPFPLDNWISNCNTHNKQG
jgi:hypothetical protein